MKILKSWLQDYIDIENISDQELDNKITFSGIEVEGIIKSIDDKVVVAQIIKIEKHPNADRLQLATVFNGASEQVVVCGAPNIEIGQKVPLAQTGAILPGGFEIKSATIRGVESNGMLCAADELGLGEDHNGIIVLPEDTKVGTKFNEISRGDTVFDLKPTPNRGDCFSHIGIAREIAALTNQSLKKDDIDIENPEQSDLSVSIESGQDCMRYLGTFIKDVKIEESPEWLKKRLLAIGAKPINNIVDITNYVMQDLGEPLHAFDATKVLDHSIIVRRANDLEDIVTLDGEIRHLTPDNLVIADKEKAIAVAGVMGGQNSEISKDTTEIILEAALFASTVIRKSSKILNLSTEASYRFERNVDPLVIELALNKATKMITDIAGGQVIDIKKQIAKEYETREITVPYDKINSILGLELANDKINDILSSLGFTLENNVAKVPSWRADISIWQDLAEEVGRVYDLNKITPVPLPKTTLPPKSNYYKKEFIKDILVENGFSEIAAYSIISEEDAKVANLDVTNLLELANPVQPENKYMRNSLIPGLLKTIAKNPTFDPILIFEVGNVFTKESENTNIALASSGKNAKKMLEKALESLKRELNYQEPIEINELSRDELLKYKIRKPVTYFLEISTEKLIENSNFEEKDLSLKIFAKNIHYRPISKFPSLTRDLAFILNKDTDADMVADIIYNVSALINRVELFDEFAHERFGDNNKNIAFHLYLQHAERTLTDIEADDIINTVVKEVENNFSAKLRDK